MIIILGKKKNKKKMEENFSVNLDNDNYQQEINPNVIKFWHIFVVIICFFLGLFISTFVICGTNNKCREHIPTMHNLMESTLILPFIITAVNIVFLLHFLISIGIYYLTKNRAQRFIIFQVISTIATYISIVITLFVFPFTDWKNDYANYFIIFSLCLWMLSNVICLIKHYKHNFYAKKNLIVWNISSAVTYCLSSITYFILQTFFPLELAGILASEICSGLSIVIFMVLCFIHLWKLELVIRIY